MSSRLVGLPPNSCRRGHMRIRILVTVLLAPILAVALGATASSADPVSSGLGLWSNGYAPATAPTDCNRFFSDSNNFCVADDGASVELGVKFTTARATQITGVRFYRADPTANRVSLWASNGGLLATAPLTPLATNAPDRWQDVSFSSPVSIVPGTTYT